MTTERPAPRAPLGGAQARWPFLVALLGALVAVGIVLLVGRGSTGSRQGGTGLTKSGAVACPEFFQDAYKTTPTSSPWVPAKPAGVHSKVNMVPKLHPTHVTVCAYLGTTGAHPKSLRLSGQHELGGELDRVVDTLRTLPAAAPKPPLCDLYVAPSDADDYLIGLRYAEAIVWVSAPGNHCSGAGNGVFRTDRNVSAYAKASYAARTWVSSPN